MSASGTKRTCQLIRRMSTIGGKAANATTPTIIIGRFEGEKPQKTGSNTIGTICSASSAHFDRRIVPAFRPRATMRDSRFPRCVSHH